MSRMLMPPTLRASGSAADWIGADALAARAVLTLHDEADAGRAGVETFVRQVYAARYGAEIDRFAPVLTALRLGDELVAAAGYRAAAAGPLFLEQYLRAP